MSESVRKPKFDRGDLVRHRASGEQAVITEVCTSCMTPEHQGMAAAIAHGPRMTPPNQPCRQEFSGLYSLSTGFGKYKCAVEEYLLEHFTLADQ